MFDRLVAARNSLDEIAAGFDASGLSPEAAVRVVQELGAIRRVVDGMTAKAAKRVVETNTGSMGGISLVARTLGVPNGEVRRAIETATLLEALPVTAAAVRAGELSAREAQLIADAATANPAAEHALLTKAEQGLVPLRDACVQARAAVEDPDERRTRHHRQRAWTIATRADAMMAGYFCYRSRSAAPSKPRSKHEPNTSSATTRPANTNRSRPTPRTRSPNSSSAHRKRRRFPRSAATPSMSSSITVR